MTARTAAKEQSWDDFWAEVSTGRTEVIRGVEVQVPTDVPLILERRINELQDSEREEDVAELISLLFGTDCMEQWREAGMGLQEFQTILTWGIAHASGQEMSFAEAYEIVKKGEGAGKAPPNRAARRSQSNATGGRSKATSSASTTSARKRSRTSPAAASTRS
ncbi:hypothetical protein ACFWFF_01600 [Streptomyces sp. NPDC060223]|uniref:hypothetical protein n=1 Tax=unclassified Streptomyces TaxID=2593676 RepID=UPI0036372306